MTTLYSKVCSDILDQISEGALKIGDRLPPEADYAERLGISRSTLRLALSELETAGIVRRRKRWGTEIISDSPQQRFNMATASIDELLSLGRDTEFRILSTQTVAGSDIDSLKEQESETGYWLEVFATRQLPGEATPFSVNRVYVPARFAGIEPILSEKVTSVFRSIESTFGLSVGRITQSTTAIECPAEDAVIMALKPGAPILQIEAELYAKDGRLIEVSVANFDPKRFQVNTSVEVS